MSILIWFTIGLAIWHFAVFVPDRFRGGIVGALLGAVAGALLSGALVQIALGSGIGETNVGTALAAMPGAVIGLWLVYLSGVRAERAEGAEA